MELSEIQQVLALRAVLNPKADPGYTLRRVFRWYAEAFHTPLHEVYELPLADVLEHYFEVHYEGLRKQYEEKGDPQLKVELDRLLMTPQELAATVAAEEAEEMDRDKFAEKVAKQEQSIEKAGTTVAKALKELGDKIPQDINMNFMNPAQFDEDALEQPAFTLFEQPKPMITQKSAAATISPARPSTPRIKIARVSQEEFDELLNEEGGLKSPPRKPQS